MLFTVLFLIVAAVLVGSAGAVVVSRNLVHSVFWLAATLLSTAVVFVSLEAAFLAGIQVVLYAGGVITLMLFGVMLTQREPDTTIPNPLARRGGAAVTAALVLATLLYAIWATPELALTTPVDSGAAIDVGRLFLGPHLLAFEVLSVLLLAAMVGAIVLVRKRDP